jgi:hypothetical protein
MINVFLDIETIPSQSPEYAAKVREGIKPPGNIKKAESIAAWLAENADTATDEAIAKTSFDPAHGHICCIGWAVGDYPAVSASAHSLNQEADILGQFFSDLVPDYGIVRFIAHNAASFDLRFILCRAIALGVKLPSTFPRDIKPWSDTVFDTMVAWAGNGKFIGQSRLAEALGIPVLKGDMDGSKVAQAWADGRHDEIAKYCRSDVETVRAIYRKFEAVGY